MRSRTIVDDVLKRLNDLQALSSFTSDQKDGYVQLTRELKHLNNYVLCLAKWNYSPFGKDKNFGFVKKFHIESALERAARRYQMSEWYLSELLEIIQLCKPKIEEDCLDFLNSSFQCDFSIDDLPEFMSSISASLHSLLNLKADVILDAKVKIRSLADNLDLFKEVLQFTSKWCSSEEDLNDFKIHTQAWVSRAACLSLLYWVQDVKDENMAARRDVILSDLHKTISPSTPEVTRMSLAVLKASKPSGKDHRTASRLVMKFVEFLKDNLRVNPKMDSIQMLFIDLIFSITFLMVPPEKFSEGKFISLEAAILNEVASLISSLSSNEINGAIAEERNFLLHTFLEKANAAKTMVREFCAHLFPDPSSSDFPSVNVLGFINSLLENLEEFYFHFPNHQIVMLREELLSLRESNLQDFSILELQNKHKDIKNLWTRIVNVAYNAERAVSSFMYIKDTLWQDILCLSDVIEEVKLIKGEMKRIQDQHMYDIHALNSETSPNPLLPLHANILVVDKVFVGFNNELRELQDQLMGGAEKLHIISIVGMPGLGKTTLAKKVCTDTSIQHHFHKHAWCTVSQQLNRKRMLLQILSDVAVSDHDISEMEEEDLAQRVYKSLKGHRYLIVMDDIWDVSAWDALRMSFPEDNSGSRIMLTSRIHNVISEAKLGHNLFPLSPLSEEKSWELLEKKLFDHGSCPGKFIEIGKQIATNCKGIPLAIVLTAGLLKEKIESLEWWKQVVGNLDLLIVKEGCRDILELSYKHLPEYLKPCFLYFGLFQEDEEIRVKSLILLWISEGLIQKHEIKSLKVMAEEYLMDLVARSLVMVNKRSSTGGMKACSVHDLLHDFCIAKGEEEKVIKVIRGKEDWSTAAKDANYRVSIRTHDCWESLLECAPPGSSIHSIIYTQAPYPKFADPISLSYFQFSRVVHSNLIVREFPAEIFIFLRYLSISFDFCIPPSIKRLENLQTLKSDFVTWLNELPLTLWEMQKLRHVSGNLRLPTDFCDYHVSPLENVQTFSIRYLPQEDREMFFRTIPKVRKLNCHLSSDTLESRQIVKLDFLSYLESLSMDREISLGSANYAFHFPSSLKKLTLKNFELQWSEMLPIAKLPNLEVLKLCGSFSKGIWNVGDNEFLKLKCLVLNTLYIQQLNASHDSFSCLERLEVAYCFNLKKIPSRFGSISTLKMIRVLKCTSTVNSSVMQIQGEQMDLGNEDLEVLILDPQEDLGNEDLDVLILDPQEDGNEDLEAFKWDPSREMKALDNKMKMSRRMKTRRLFGAVRTMNLDTNSSYSSDSYYHEASPDS